MNRRQRRAEAKKSKGRKAGAASAGGADPAADLDSLRGWTPFRLLDDGGRQAVYWTRLGPKRFTEPFFNQTIAEHLRSGANPPVRVTKADALKAAANLRPSLAPSGFIFHMSRCGSTLLANALKNLDSALVIAEPAPVIELLCGGFGAHGGGQDRAGFFRGLIAALGQPRRAADRQYFIKFTSANVRCFPFIRSVFPHVPCLFLYRRPVEVLVSVLRRPPGWLRSRARPAASEALLRLPVTAMAELSEAEFAARVLGAICQSGLALSEQGAVLNYRQLAPAALPGILRFLGIAASGEQLGRMAKAFDHYSKEVGAARKFRGDSKDKQAAATPELRKLADAWVMKAYEQLEARRMKVWQAE